MFWNRIYLLIIVIIYGCNNSSPVDKSNLDTVNVSNQENKNKIEAEDTTGFFANCQKLVDHSSLGSLQGVEADKDSLKNLYFADCFDYCRETFQIIFVHKDPNKREDQQYNSLSEEFHNGCSDYFKSFYCFAFICPRRDPDKQENIHALNIDFPVVMRIYERMSMDDWKYIKTVTAKTYDEYALVRFKTIYHLH